MGLKRKIIANNCLNTRGIILRTVHGITTKLNQPALERKGRRGSDRERESSTATR